MDSIHNIWYFNQQRLRAVLCRARCVGLVVTALALPGVAYPYSLRELLHLPFETLLTLEVSAPGKPQKERTATPPRAGASRD